MKIKFKNLAQVKEAEIEDKQLMVLIGDNGTGKTLILETLTFIRTFYQDGINIMSRELINEYQDLIKLDYDKDIIEEFTNVKIHLDSETQKESSIAYTHVENKKNLDVIFELKEVDKINDAIKEKIVDKYSSVFNLVNKNILLTDQTDFSFEFLELPEFSNSMNLSLKVYFSKKKDRILFRVNDGDLRIFNVVNLDKILFEKLDMESPEAESYFELTDRDTLIEIIEKNLKLILMKFLLSNYFGDTRILFLPSERNLIMDNALLKASEINLDSEVVNQRYSERLFNSSYLRFKNLTETIPMTIEKINGHVKKLFGGKLNVSEDGEITSLYKDDGTEIKRELFSTKQNRMIPFLLIHDPISTYKNIIIEEPEAHLSLKSIKVFLEYLKELLEKKKNIFITTHSDVFFLFLCNILLNNDIISVNVYELKEEEEHKTILKKVERNEYGYEIELFTNLLNDLYDETLRIQNKVNL